MQFGSVFQRCYPCIETYDRYIMTTYAGTTFLFLLTETGLSTDMPFCELAGVPLPFFAALPIGVLEVARFEMVPFDLGFGVAAGLGAVM
jgi:hypothetical protein